MFEKLLEWLRRILGQPSNPLEKLDIAKLRDKVSLLDIDRGEAVKTIEKLQAERMHLVNEARSSEGVRRQELARQVVYIDQDIGDKQAQLDQIHQQRKAIRQFMRFAERADLMRKYGVDKILGRKLDMAQLEAAIQGSVAGGVLDTENLNRASAMLSDALEYTRTVVQDEEILKVLQEIEGPVEAQPSSEALAEAPVERPLDREIEDVLREIERE